LAEEKVVERLLHFGFTKTEAEAYLFLLMAGPCPAGVVAYKLKINRMKAYRTLKALEERRAAEVTVERPVKFVPTPLKEVLEQCVEETKVKASAQEESMKEIINDWEKLYKVEAVVEKPKFRILESRRQVYDLLLQMCERAKSTVRLVTTRNDLYRLQFAGVDDTLKGFKDVKVSVLTQVDQSGIKAVEDYLRFAEVRHIGLPTTMRFLVIDESEAVTTFAMDDSMSITTQDDTGLWTNAASYVKAMEASFDALWRTGVPAQEVLNGLKTEKMLVESLRFAKEALEAAGWAVTVPGKLIGNSRVEYTFSLVARHPEQLDKPLVLDLIAGEEALQQIVALRAKVMEVKPIAQFLVSAKPLCQEEVRLADLYGVSVIYTDEAEGLAVKIRDEANRILKR
jgi:sugar-specific transcriptional regulator TrmB